MKQLLVYFLFFLSIHGLHARDSYTTADILLLRRSPGRSAPIVGQIPYGSLVTHNDSAIMVDALHWVYATNAGGYIAQEYLSPVQPALWAKKLSLKSYTAFSECNSDGSSSSETLTLGSGQLKYEGGGFNVSYTARYSGTGIYELIPGGIRIEIQRLTAQITFPGPNPGQQAGPQPVHIERVLHFDQRLTGFLLDRQADSTNYPYLFPGMTTLEAARHPIDLQKCSYTTTGCMTSTRGYLCAR